MTANSERLSAALADRYRIERELGQGGMATVYLAQDLKHDRQVAIKVLKPELAAVLGAERFVVEIKTTAALQHPHILPRFDSGSADGFLFYVMPYVEGETLRDKLNRETQFGVDEAVRIACEVADALDYAHRRGVIHRDIKPENILLHDGRPMVADFGIALALSAAAGGRMTETGLSLGTPHYMSPEQATAEKEITGRSDVYSLASVLYEMLAGQPPHLGGSAQQIIMKIIAEPVAAVTQFRKAVPPNVAAAVAKALEKLPADRFATASEFAGALKMASFTLEARAGAETIAMKTSRLKERAAIPLVAGLILAVIAAAWGWTRPAPDAPVVRFPITMPDSAELIRQPGILLALSADGSRLVYIGPGDGDVDIWERPLNSLVGTRVPETNGADSPFLSTAGDVVAFYRQNPPRLFTASLRGGPRQTWVQDSTVSAGGDFGPDGAIYFTRVGGIRRVREPGGPVEQVTSVDSAQGEQGHSWVDVLPNGKGALFTIVRSTEDQYDIAAVDLRTNGVKVLVRGTYARYSPSGHIVYSDASGGLFALSFDAKALATRGAPIPLVSGVSRGEGGVAHFTLSETGVMMYATGGGGGSEELVWVDRQGGTAPTDSTLRGPFYEIALSPNGRRIAMSSPDAALGNIWIKDLPNGPLQKLTLEGDNFTPSWSPDGRTVYFISVRSGSSWALYGRRVDEGANPFPVTPHVQGMRSASVSPDGSWVVYTVTQDIFARRTKGDTATVRLVATPAAEVAPTLSPDGRWLAYVSLESGVPEVYVSPFPDVASGRTVVSIDGGTEPHWAPNGRELFFSGPGLRFIAAQVELTPTFRVRERRVLFDRSGFLRVVQSGAAYDVAPGGQRFVMYRSRTLRSDKFVLVQNWPAELAGRPIR